jgi:hypothetical protein
MNLNTLIALLSHIYALAVWLKLRPLNHPYITGNTRSVRIVVVTIPPTITSARGLWASEPMECDKAAGGFISY